MKKLILSLLLISALTVSAPAGEIDHPPLEPKCDPAVQVCEPPLCPSTDDCPDSGSTQNDSDDDADATTLLINAAVTVYTITTSIL